MIWALILMITVAIAYRGKGGGLAEWGLAEPGKNNVAHLEGAVMVAAMCTVATADIELLLPIIATWLLFTKPSTDWSLDLCGGFTWLRWLKSTARQLLILPTVLILFHWEGGNYEAFIACLGLGSLYWIGGAINRYDPRYDAVEVAEWLTGLAGLTLYWAM